MKTATHLFFAIALLFSCTVVKAQDTLFLKSGVKVASQITEITPSLIRYKKADNPDGPTFVINAWDATLIKYRNGSIDTIKSVAPVTIAVEPSGSKAPVLSPAAPAAPAPAKPLDLHPPIYSAGLFYKYDNRRIKRREMQNILNNVHNEEIDLHVKKARTAKGLEYLGFVAIPTFAFGLGYTGVALLNNWTASSVSDEMAYAPGVTSLVVAAAALGTSITFKIIGRNHNEAAIRIYNEKY